LERISGRILVRGISKVRGRTKLKLRRSNSRKRRRRDEQNQSGGRKAAADRRERQHAEERKKDPEVCRFHLRGRCKFGIIGSQCRWKHPPPLPRAELKKNKAANRAAEKTARHNAHTHGGTVSSHSRSSRNKGKKRKRMDN